MHQISFSDVEFAGQRKRTRREVFLAEMDKVVPWTRLTALIEPVYPKAGNGRRPYAVETMLRLHFMQQWFALSDPAMEESLYDITPIRQFAGLSLTRGNLPDETTILNFRLLLERNHLSERLLTEINAVLSERGLLLRRGTIVDATIIAAPSSTKNRTGQRDPEMHQTKKGNQWHFGMKGHIGVDAESGLVHTVIGTAANVSDVTQAGALLHGKESTVFADSGYTGVAKRVENKDRKVDWHIAAKPSAIKRLHTSLQKRAGKIEHLKASIRSKVEHPFRVIKRQFGYTKVRYRGLAKNAARIKTLFALSNLWMARRHLTASTG